MEKVILIAEQLSKEGVVPNTALIKARLASKVPLPVIIQGLKMWKENPQQAIGYPANEATENKTLLDSKIAQAIAPLKTEIALLRDELQELKKQLNKEDKNRVY